mmetsp:Transcript_22092/g.53513  ORF Transcript_22092/g.53513 Transcript_22092/m.53513 type:complete len:97 (-) Transcript_22092:682-972(-)
MTPKTLSNLAASSVRHFERGNKTIPHNDHRSLDIRALVRLDGPPPSITDWIRCSIRADLERKSSAVQEAELRVKGSCLRGIDAANIKWQCRFAGKG